MKTANGWVKPKKGAAGKTSRASKEEAIRKDLGLTAGEDMSRFSDEQIEKMYAKTQQTPEQQKADFDKSKIGQAVNKGRQEFAAEKTRQKELASKTNAIGLPKENKPAESKPAASRREAVSAGRMMKDLDGNFWSRPEDFKEDITSRGWDVDEMTNEYAVISNEAGSQYEVRFDDHSDDGDLTVRNFKALQIDEDDDDDSLEDAAPRIRQLTGDTRIRVRKA
jgi:hypothetical protein